ncbi:cation diffusion facilitator family transporter [candidate division KSB1 bacterium]|nr:cation diffusion facilitator family transporter [candidate division KSB1 bacterium]
MIETTHSHSHIAIDPGILSTRRGVWALKISLAGLGLTAVFQVIIVAISGSAGLLADTIHNFADAFTSLPLWFAFYLRRRPANRRFTYGYGRAEDVAGIVIVLVIFSSAMLVGYESYRKLIGGEAPQNLSWVMVAGVIGFLGNEAVAQFRIKVGKEIGSAALVADGRHSRIDGFTSLAVLLGALGVKLGFPAADPIVGLLITLAIFGIVLQAGREVFSRVMDSVDPHMIDEIERVASGVEEAKSVHDVRARWLGHEIHVELSIGVDRKLSVDDGHHIATHVQHELLHHIPHLHKVTIHVDPDDKIGEAKHFHSH